MKPIPKPKTFKEFNRPYFSDIQRKLFEDIMVAANAINRNQRQYPASSYILIGQEYHQILEESLKNIGTFDHNPIRVYQDPIDDILRNGIDFINFNTDEIGERRPY